MYSDDDYLIDREECVNAYYKELKQQIETAESTEEILEIVNNVIETKDKKIKELEEENKIYILNGDNVKLELYIKENYIPVQKVKDKIEGLKKDYEDSKDENGETEYYYPDYTIRKLEELLEDK